MKTIFKKGGEKNMATEQKIKTSSKEILDIIGGKDNIISAAHCATRLRLVLKDESIVDLDRLSDVEIVKGYFSNSGQFQIIIGSGTVDEVYKEIIALEPSAYMRTAFMARLMEHNEVKERISLLPIDVGKYSFRDKISGVMCMGVLGHLKRDEQEKLLYKLDKNLNINVPILIELLEPKFLVAPVGSRISVATQGRLRYETYITDIKQVGMDQWTWRLTYKVFCGKNIVSTVDSLMSWNYQSVEKILNQLTKMHFRTAKLSETLLLAIKAR